MADQDVDPRSLRQRIADIIAWRDPEWDYAEDTADAVLALFEQVGWASDYLHGDDVHDHCSANVCRPVLALRVSPEEPTDG